MTIDEVHGRVLVLAPVGRDAPVIAEVLRQAGLGSEICANLTAFCEAMARGAAAAVIAEEALFGKDLTSLMDWAEQQPSWSDLPFLVLTSRQDQSAVAQWRQQLATKLRNVSLLERPVQGITLTTMVQAAVRARLRQYELRSILEVQERAAQQLEELVAARTRELEEANDALRAQVTERARVEEALRHGQKMEALGQLTGGIAHDFNNMLQGMTGSLEIAQRRLEEGRTDDVIRFLKTAREAAHRAGTLTQRLLTFARRQRLDPRRINPDELVVGLAELIDRTMGPTIQVQLITRSTSTVVCDANELESTLLNLCINARDAMPNGGKLIIGTDDVTLSAAEVAEYEGAAPGAYTALWVRDTGTGMTPDVLSRAFEPFFTTKPMGQGTGLGLSQVYGFVRQSGGFVRLESNPQGTTVWLFLPRYAQVETSTRAPAAAMPDKARTGETVLVVDDEASIRQAVAERLRELAYSVVEAEDGPSAMQVVQTERHLDLLITDVGLPNGMNGRQLAEIIRERQPTLAVLFITGYSGTILPPGVEVISKPFDLDVLARRVQAVLAAAQRNRDPDVFTAPRSSRSI